MQRYRQWCERTLRSYNHVRSIQEYRQDLINRGRSRRYACQSARTIATMLCLELPLLSSPQNMPLFTLKELKLLYGVSINNYHRDETLLILNLIFDLNVRIGQIKRWTRNEIKKMIERNQYNKALLFILAMTFDIPDNQLIFKKTFATYSCNFKKQCILLLKRTSNFHHFIKSLKAVAWWDLNFK